MLNESETGRRDFLGTAVTAAGAALAFGLFRPDAQGQEAGPRVPPAATSLSATTSLSFDSLYDTSVLATSLRGETADRLALRRLVDAWAHCADRRLAERQSNLFLPDGTLFNYEGEPSTHEPHSTLRGRAAIRTALAVLNSFSVTLHLNGQSDVIIQGERAIGETYCLVHQFTVAHVTGTGVSATDVSGTDAAAGHDQRKCQALGIRYYDQFSRVENRWYFAERRLVIDWSDSRISVP